MESIDDMTLGRLATFVAAVENGSFRDAADDRGIVPSTVQKHMRGLERTFGLALFERDGRNVRVTPEARELCDAARALLDSAQTLQLQLDRLNRRTTDTVRVACVPLHLARFLGGVVRSMEATAPDVNIQMDMYSSETMKGVECFDALLADGEADFVATINALPTRSSLSMWRTKVVVVVPEDHHFRRRSSVSVEELTGETIFAQSPHIWSRRHLDRLINKTDTSLAIVSESVPDVAVGLVLAGFGIAVVADDCLSSLGTYPALMDDGSPIIGDVKLHWNQDTLTPASRRFLKEARSLRRKMSR